MINIETFFCLLFCLGWGLLCFVILFYGIVYPYTSYMVNKGSNKVQWRCEETFESKCDRISNPYKEYVCDISYRVIPCELNKFVRIFGCNKWKYVFFDTKINDKENFLKLVNDLTTIKDINNYKDKKNNVLWYKPENI